MKQRTARERIRQHLTNRELAWVSGGGIESRKKTFSNQFDVDLGEDLSKVN